MARPPPSARRIALALLATAAGVVGVWALFAPASFYADFVFGRGWVRLDGPYNEHLIRDVGALNLALACVTIVAAVKMDTLLVRLAAGSTVVFAVPHLIYHAGAMAPFTTGDVIAQSVALVLQVVVPVWLFASPGPPTAPSGLRRPRSRAMPQEWFRARVGERARSDRLTSMVILRVDAVFLGSVGLVQAALEMLGHFGTGPQARIFDGQPFTIGFVEAHLLAVLLAAVLYRVSSTDRPAPWHLLAAVVHLVLGGANVLFWSSFHAYDMIRAGIVATTLHGVLLVLQIAAYVRAERIHAERPADSGASWSHR